MHRLACELLANVLKNNEKIGEKQTKTERGKERERMREKEKRNNFFGHLFCNFRVVFALAKAIPNAFVFANICEFK